MEHKFVLENYDYLIEVQAMIARWLLTVGLALLHFHAGVDKFLTPELWIRDLPLWMEGFLSLSNDVWVGVVGTVEIVLALMILVPVAFIRRLGAILMAVHLGFAAITVGWNERGVRDIALLLAALALVSLIHGKKKTQPNALQ